mmetsp:Transcript_32008/g.70106  ORF Transcript_32008/g.70106 Transcript_32008/m.70106 type:complete len:362 (+) Transcript_32008:1258-2343(+)
MDVRAGSDWPAATPARLWELQAQWVARESRSESVGVAEKSLASLCAPLDDALDSTPRQNALEPWKDLEQWRLYCVDFNRFRAKNRDKAKRLIRAGIPEPIRGAVWQQLAQSRDVLRTAQYPPLLYHHLRTSKNAPCETEFIRDIDRTFPKHLLFHEKKGLGQNSLLNVLRAYSVFNPEVGYCQGMGFVTGLLLMYNSEEDTFLMLVSLLENYEMAGLFRPGLPLLNRYFFQLQRLIQIHLPALYEHLGQHGVEPSMYASQWFMTVCIANFPFATVVRVWDIFLNEGIKIVFRVALALLKLNQERLLAQTFEQILLTLREAPRRIEDEPLIQVALAIKLKNTKLKELEQEYVRQDQGGHIVE